MSGREKLKAELLRILQYDFPIAVEPWKEIANKLDIGEDEVLELVKELKEEGTIRRIGAILNKDKLGYKSLLIALKVEGDYNDVVEFINSHVAVTHNYLRDDEWNIWFTFNYADEGELNEFLEKLRAYPQVVDLMLLPSEKMIKIDARF